MIKFFYKNIFLIIQECFFIFYSTFLKYMPVLSFENLKDDAISACNINNLPQNKIRTKMVSAIVRLQKEMVMENDISKSNLKVVKKESGKNLINNQRKQNESIKPTKLNLKNQNNKNIII